MSEKPYNLIAYLLLAGSVVSVALWFAGLALGSFVGAGLCVASTVLTKGLAVASGLLFLVRRRRLQLWSFFVAFVAAAFIWYQETIVHTY